MGYAQSLHGSQSLRKWHKSSIRMCALFWICGVGSWACQPKSTPESAEGATQAKAGSQPAATTFDRNILGAFAPLPRLAEVGVGSAEHAKIELGYRLYYETRLSKNHDISCNTCHQLAGFGAEDKATSTGHKGHLGPRNAPTVLNASLHSVQFWDGRAPDVEQQALGPIANPGEMASSEAKVLQVLQSIPAYVESFQAAFPSDPQPVNFANVGQAIGAFERQLITPSAWDSFLQGDDQAISQQAKMGAATFVEVGCVTCHMGATVGGTLLQKVGLVKPWPNQQDLGRYQVTQAESDKMLFKVPSLRNVSQTAPYFHDGSVPQLTTAIEMMAQHQLGKTLTPDQVTSIATFLETLTSPAAKQWRQPPVLPVSTKKTPKPDPS